MSVLQLAAILGIAVLGVFVLVLVNQVLTRIDELAPPQITIRTDIHWHDFQPTDDNGGTVCSCGLSHIHEFRGGLRCYLDACGRWFEDEEATR